MAILLALTEVVLALGAIILAGLLYFHRNKKDPRYPPGPRGVPLFGNVLQLGRDPVRILEKFAKEYGPIYSIRMGTQDTIILNDPKLVKELFSDIKSTGRPDNLIMEYLSGRNGIVNGQGPNWESQRRFTLRKLRDFGVLKSSIEASLLEETARLIVFLDKRVGKTVLGRKLFNGPVVNSLWKLIAGETNDWDSPVKPKILELATAMIEAGNRTVESGLFFASSLRFIAPGYYGWTEWVESVNKFNFLIKNAVLNHAEKLYSNEPNDFIDHYLVEIKNALDPASFFYKENGEQNLDAVVADLFIAGSETSSNTLSFTILYLMLNKDVQQKAQLEMDQVVGSCRQISLADKVLLPYTEAVLLEALRLTSIVPLGLPHRMIEDTIFHGFFLPKNATVISNLWAIHHDPKIWGDDVNEFRPERFLSEDKTRVIRHDALMPFSAGRRQCIGEGLARDTMFLFLANILLKFNIEKEPGCPVMKIEAPTGLLAEPQPFNFVLNLRNS